MAQKTGDYYKLLGLPRDAPDREIKRAYYKLARDLHPDKAKSEDERARNADALASISQAYNTLKDPRKRAEYDAARGYTKQSGKPAPSPGADSEQPAAPGTPSAPSQPASAPKTPAAKGPAQVGTPRISEGDMRAQRKSMAQKAFVRGMQFFKRQELKEALPLFETAVTQDPESEPHYHLKYAQCLMRTKGSYNKAVKHAQAACEMDPYNIEFKLMLAEIHETAGANSKAVEVYQDVLRWDPTNAVAKIKLEICGKGAKGKSLLGGSQSALGRFFPSLFSKK